MAYQVSYFPVKHSREMHDELLVGPAYSSCNAWADMGIFASFRKQLASTVRWYAHYIRGENMIWS